MTGRKLRVCLVVPSHWSANVGGAEMQVRMLVDRLAREDALEIHYLARNLDPAHRPSGYSLHRISTARAIAGTFLLDVPKLLWMLFKLRPDVIYQRVACAYSGACSQYARITGKRMLWHVSSDRDLTPARHGWLSSPLRRLNKALVNSCARNVATVIVQNQQQKQLLHEHFGRSDAVPIANFHDGAVESTEKQTSPRLVCWVGNIKPLKQLEVFLRLAEDHRDRGDLRFIVIGAVQMPEQQWNPLRARIEAASNVEYLGRKDLDFVNELLGRASLLVNTSTAEGFPNTFIQAWLRRTPALSLTVDPDGVFASNRYGICAHSSYEQMREGFRRLMDDDVLRHEIGERAQRFAVDRFSARNLEQLVELIRSGSTAVERA